MLERIQNVGELIKKANHVHIVTHIDADGLTSGAIAVQTLKRLEISYSIEFVKQLDASVIDHLRQDKHGLVWFTDLGSSIVTEPPCFPMVVTDHHSCSKESDVSFHFNPHLFGVDGSYELSGAGAAYLISKAIDSKNTNLSALAIVGACGDLQNHKFGKLVGLNREILKDATNAHVIDSKVDISFFGRETRPVYKMLQYANNPTIPGVSGRESAALSMLSMLRIPVKDAEVWRRWIDLSTAERRRIISHIAQVLLTKGFSSSSVKHILGETYILVGETPGTELHDAKEFATLLNSTARYDKYEIGLQVCLGDRTTNLLKAQSLLQGHRHNLVEGVQFAKSEGIEQREYVQFFHAKAGIRDTIVGIVTNMLLHDEETRNDLPIVGFAEKSDTEVKASARATQQLVDKGLDLSVVIRKAALEVNGVGGGHNIAAGATIPKGSEEAFLHAFEKEVKHQLS
ncbi:MAG: DHH family phosphoesterase [Thermoplasmatota archaeon]